MQQQQQPSPYQLPPQYPGYNPVPQPRKRTWLWITLGAIGGLAMLCVLGVAALFIIGNSPAAQQAANEKATAVAATSVALSGEEQGLLDSSKEIFNESFDNNDAGFDASPSDGSTVAIGDGVYQATFSDTAYRSVYSQRELDSFISEVDCKVVSGDGSCGIIFGVHEIDGKTDNDEIFFFVSGNSYGVRTRVDGSDTSKKFSNSAIKDSEGAVNHLRVVRVDDEARLYINDQLIDRIQVTDEKLKSGSVGFSVGSNDTKAVVEVDNWKVYQIN